ncbi:MAG: hypothetical protein LBD96_00910 [Treponema sp.]|jgi:protein-tyrosine-phosphatase|nr:hypothetical protein [Treponema sp.]
MKVFLALFSLALSLGPLSAQAPSWYLDREEAYPSRFYISAVGEGVSRGAAETAAVAGVSLFFNTSTQVRNEAIREFNQVVSDTGSDLSKKTYASEQAVIRSEEEFLGVQFADPWYDQARRVWAALAYIDRREAARIYGSRITANMGLLRAVAADAEGEMEPLYACGLLSRAAGIGTLTEELIKTAVVVDPAVSYAEDLALIQELRSAYRTRRAGLSFGVSVTSPESPARLERKLQQLLETMGAAVTTRNPLYMVSAVLSADEGSNMAGYYVRPGISIRVERGGEALFSYGKNYERFNNLSSTSGAYNRAFIAIEKDLEENFITQFAAMIGGK